MGDHESVDQLASFFMTLHRISGFPLSFARIRRFAASEKDFSLALEMTHGEDSRPSSWLSCRYGELCLFEALYPAPLARPFSKGLLTDDYLTWAFIPPVRLYPALLSC